MAWHSQVNRPLPWKGEKNPYLIWLSEIILQQTRAEQGRPYFEKFKEKYPTVHELAHAPEDEVMKLWEGLGYYSRARNLHSTAKYIAFDLAGNFPDTYEGIRSLKGVGGYTAAAIASFAFGMPHAVVDGNVFRVLSRFWGVDKPVDTTEGKKEFARIAQQALEKAVEQGTGPGPYNQAIMDFGAVHCTPSSPLCPACPLRPSCAAYHLGKVESLPMKSKKMERRQRHFNYLIINQKENVFIQKRTHKDIWQNLYEFPLIETEALPADRSELIGHHQWAEWLGQGQAPVVLRVSQPYRQELTHQRIVAQFWELEVAANFPLPQPAWQAVPRKTLPDFAFPKVIDLYIQQKFLPLELF